MGRKLMLAAAVLSSLAGCGGPDFYPPGERAAATRTTDSCAGGCGPGNVRVRMDMTVGAMLVDRK